MFTHEYFTGQVLSVPVAHGDGRYTADPDVIASSEGEGRVAFRYCSRDRRHHAVKATSTAPSTESPESSSEAGNVLGMMPHPERAVDPIIGTTDGLGVFDSLLGGVTA